MRRLVAITVVALALPWIAAAQELPTAPSTSQQQARETAFREQIDVPPSYSPALTAGDKFQIFVQESASPFTFSAAAASAGLMHADGGARGFAGGWNGAQRRYAAAVADTEIGNFFSKFLIPVLAKQDPRYKRNGHESVGARFFDALSQVVEIDDEHGEPQFNYSQVLGTAVSATISNAYYPLESRGIRRTGERFGAHMAAGAGINVVREFLPDVKRFFLGRHVPGNERDALTWRTGTMSYAPKSVD